MIRKPKKPSKLSKLKSRKRSNPSSELISTKINNKGDNWHVTALVAGQKIITVITPFKSYDQAKIAADATKEALILELSKLPKKRSNPDEYRLRESTEQSVNSMVGLPDDKMQSFELGRLYGLQLALTDYCGALNFLKRRKVLKTINKAISNALGGLARKIEVRGEGIETPIPMIKKFSRKE